MSTLKEDLTAIKEIQDGLVGNKVARFSYTQNAYDANTVDGVNEYNVNNEQNIPNGTASIMKVNSTVLDKGYRAQASSITRMLMNHFLGRISYNLNKVNDNMQNLLSTLITKFPTSLPANGGTADSATTADKVANSLTFGDKTFNGSSAQTIKASDLGLLPPNLGGTQTITLVDDNSILVPFTVPSDGWILRVSTPVQASVYLLINNKGSLTETPCQLLDIYTISNSVIKICNYLNCPYPVKKGQIISTDSSAPRITFKFAPCLGN